jgi:pimeloyl-ACP methyl ester carboxylesterase
MLFIKYKFIKRANRRYEVARTYLFHRIDFIFFLIHSIDKVPKVTSPVLMIHGTDDEVINFSHGLAIYERCPLTVEPLWVEVITLILFISR